MYDVSRYNPRGESTSKHNINYTESHQVEGHSGVCDISEIQGGCQKQEERYLTAYDAWHNVM